VARRGPAPDWERPGISVTVGGCVIRRPDGPAPHRAGRRSATVTALPSSPLQGGERARCGATDWWPGRRRRPPGRGARCRSDSTGGSRPDDHLPARPDRLVLRPAPDGRRRQRPPPLRGRVVGGAVGQRSSAARPVRPRNSTSRPVTRRLAPMRPGTGAGGSTSHRLARGRRRPRLSGCQFPAARPAAPHDQLRPVHAAASPGGRNRRGADMPPRPRVDPGAQPRRLGGPGAVCLSPIGAAVRRRRA